MLKGYLSKLESGSQLGTDGIRQSTYNPAMLKRIYIDNFRCFVNFEYKPERKQLLLGANGSGKSSLLDAVRAVRNFVGENGVDHVAGGILQNSATRWMNRPTQVIEIEAELDEKEYVYRLEFQASAGWPTVREESLKVDGVDVLPVPAPSQEISYSLLDLWKDGSAGASTFHTWITHDMCSFRIDPAVMENEGRYMDHPYPGFEMSDVASWYIRQTGHDPAGVDQIQIILREVFEGFSSLDLLDVQSGVKELRFSFDRAHGKQSYLLTELSEGQRCLFALYMVLQFLIGKGKTVFLDEPDNFASLREIQPWLLQAEAAADDSRGQLILISHHPEILNMWAHEYGMRLFRENGGPVRIEKYKTDYDDLLQPSEVVARGWEND